MNITVFLTLVTFLFVFTKSEETPTLIYVQEVFRHGHRHPIYSHSADGSNYVDKLRVKG